MMTTFMDHTFQWEETGKNKLMDRIISGGDVNALKKLKSMIKVIPIWYPLISDNLLISHSYNF